MIFADPSLWRIVWKEYRAQRSFWLAVAGFGAGLMLLLIGLLDAQADRYNSSWLVAWFLPAFYALGSAAVLFASEKEDGTVELLRFMSALPSRVFLGKLGFCVVSTLALYSVLIIVAALVTVGLDAPSITTVFRSTAAQRIQWAMWLGGAFLSWGLFFSSVSRKVLTAACLGACAPFVAWVIVGWAIGSPPDADDWWWFDLLLAIPLVVLSYVAAARTLSGMTIEWKRPRLMPMAARSRTSGLKWLESTDESRPAWRRQFARLLWIELRQALALWHILWIGGIYLALFVAWVPYRAGGGVALVFVLAFATIPLFMGVWTFQAEGGQRVRFLAEQGINAAVVWLSKQIIWVFMTIATMCPFVLAFEMATRQRGTPDPEVWPYCTAAVALGYAAGQFASMLVPRAVTAGFVGAVIYALLAAWMGGMIVLQVPFAISVVPVVAVLLAATLAWSHNWLLERATWRSWLWLAASVSLAVVAVWGSVGTYRLAEVPALTDIYLPQWVADFRASQKFLMERKITPDEAETARMYALALRGFRDVQVADWAEPQPSVAASRSALDGWGFATAHERALLEENRDVLEQALAATRRTQCAFFDPSIPNDERPPLIHDGLPKLAWLILFSARELESQGRLDEALERYVAVLRMGWHRASWGRTFDWWARLNLEDQVARWMPLWATQPGQTAESIASAATTINIELARLPRLSEAVAGDQLELRHQILGDWGEAVARSSERDSFDDWPRTLLLVFRRVFPWEQRRALAVAELLAYSQVQCAVTLEQGLAAPGRDLSAWRELLGIPSKDDYVANAAVNSINGLNPMAQGFAAYRHRPQSNSGYRQLPPWNLIDTTFPLPMIAPSDNSQIWHMQMRRELVRRSLLLQLALIGWKAEHGEYPAQLEQLPQNRPDIMLDPYSGRPFEYRRDGYPNAITFSNGNISAGAAVFWSGGSVDTRLVPVYSPGDKSVHFVLTDAMGRGPNTVADAHIANREAYGFSLP